MASLEKIEKRVSEIEKRNRRVESEKAWETSATRRALLALFTYLAVGLYLQAISIPAAWLNAIVPAVGFMLGTLALPFFKKQWLLHFYGK